MFEHKLIEVFAAEQTPTKIAYCPQDAARLLKEYDAHFQGLLEEIQQHQDIRESVANVYTEFFSK